MKLVSYKFKMIVPFGYGEYRTVYELTITKSILFGIIKKEVKMDYNITMFGSIKAHEEHWDNLIASGQHLSINQNLK